jgi:CRISPR/Cas system-associated exonuclease Cas4 (RecB family)
MGKGKNLIKIMTVHASKGLEFDHVILGGIHSNEVGKGGLPPLFGKNPGSFLWKKESKERKLLKTPEYFIEQEYKKIKDGFESKRMLYVACTRAKNSLSYVDVFEKGKGPKSWINAFRSFVDTKSLIKTSEINYSLSQIPLRKINRPLFHREDLGIIYKENSKESSHLGILGDISVTSLISLSECPRKFYLKNVCRFDTDNLNQAFDGEELEVVSSSQRGSQIHLEISSKIKQKDFSIHPDSSINFALDYLQTFKSDFEILSEKSFKFPLFGYMCSGIPDAILRPLRDGSFSIIDFKTGNKKEAHIFQLLAYAYGAYQLGMVDKKNKIKLILLYLDLGVTLEVFTDFQKSAEELFKVWKNLYNLDQVNLGHCKECSFHGLCYSSVATP